MIISSIPLFELPEPVDFAIRALIAIGIVILIIRAFARLLHDEKVLWQQRRNANDDNRDL